jgi:hypothetical protein
VNNTAYSQAVAGTNCSRDSAACASGPPSPRVVDALARWAFISDALIDDGAAKGEAGEDAKCAGEALTMRVTGVKQTARAVLTPPLPETLAAVALRRKQPVDQLADRLGCLV